MPGRDLEAPLEPGSNTLSGSGAVDVETIIASPT